MGGSGARTRRGGGRA